METFAENMELLADIFELLFQKIPRGIFEPFAIGAVVGGFFSLLFSRRYKYFFFFFWGAILFMLAWRLAILIISSRYTSFLIYPAVILTVYACFEAGRQLKKRTRISRTFCRLLPLLILSGIALGCLGKTFHWDPYEYHREGAYLTIREQMKKYDKIQVLVSNGDARRTKYYTGAVTRDIPDATTKVLQQEVRNFKSADTVLLLDVIESAAAPMLTKEELGVPESAEWERIYSSYTNRKERRKHNIYRYRIRVP